MRIPNSEVTTIRTEYGRVIPGGVRDPLIQELSLANRWLVVPGAAMDPLVRGLSRFAGHESLSSRKDPQ